MRRLVLAVALLAAWSPWGRLLAAPRSEIISQATAARHGLTRPWFTQVALELYDQAMLTRSAGIEFLGEESAQLVVEAICQVCGEDIGEDMVVCPRCKTPHHRDCWQYNGGCSIYG